MFAPRYTFFQKHLLRHLALAIIRVAIHGEFLKAAVFELSLAYLSWVPYPTVTQRLNNFLPKCLTEFACKNPALWYQWLLSEIAIPHATRVAFLETFGEMGVGTGLTPGCARQWERSGRTVDGK
jgi:hypothetical protein